LRFREPGIGCNNGERCVFARRALAAERQSVGRKRRGPSEPAELLVLLEWCRPEMRAVPDGHAAGRVGGGDRADGQSAACFGAGRAYSAFEIDSRCAESRADASEGKILGGAFCGFVTKLSVRRKPPPVLVAAR